MEKLNVPVPPNLEAALGYDGGDRARYVAFFWEPRGDGLAFSDGRYSVVGANRQAWLAFTAHPAVNAALACPRCSGPGVPGGTVCPACRGSGQRFNFGSGGEEATHVLLLDRRERVLYAATGREAVQLLAEQRQAIPFSPPPGIDMYDLPPGTAVVFVAEFRAESAAPDERLRQWEEATAEMLAFLDAAASAAASGQKT